MIQYKERAGSSKEKAIIILEAESELEGVDTEYRYLDFHYKCWQLDEQTLILDQGKQYDIIAIILPEGSKEEVWFDITNFYGREDE